MGKVGRKRLAGPREPNGRRSRRDGGPAVKPATPPMSPAEWQRIIQHGHLVLVDKRLISEVGRLFAAGELTAVQCAAAHRVGEIYGAFERAAGRSRSARSPSYERSFGSTDFESEAQVAFVEAATENFHDLQAFFGKIAPPLPPVKLKSGGFQARPHRLVGAIEDLCVEDRSVSPTLYPGIRSLLQAIAQESALTGRARTARAQRQSEVPSRSGKPTSSDVLSRADIDRAAWIGILDRLRPDLGQEEIEVAYELTQAIKARAHFVQSSESLRRTRADLAPRPVSSRVLRPRLIVSDGKIIIAKEEADASG